MKFLAFILVATNITFSQTIDYLGEIPPGNTPKIFAPGKVSQQGRYEYGLTVSPDGNEIFFTTEKPGDGLMVIKKRNNVWGNPEVANLRKNNSWEFEAFFTPDGNKLYFTSKTDYASKFWYMEKIEGNWNDPKYLNSPVNNTPVMWCTFTSDETMYFGNNSNWQIHRAKFINGGYPIVENLGFNGTHPSVSPDESYFLFNSSNYGGYGQNDIFIVFRNDDGSWRTPINLGSRINTSYGETCASLSPDKKYIFFSRYDEEEEKSNIYWVSSAIIDSIKKTLTCVEKKASSPTGMNLYHNYLNPFNPTTISDSLDKSAKVKLTIYNLLGHEIKILKKEFQNTGEYSVHWDGVDEMNIPVSSGFYVYSIKTSDKLFQKKMILEK